MKKNPFYGMSAAAMLFGCYMINHALEIEPGRLGKLLTLMGVLQVYEALLIALGGFLVATRRAPRDGVMVLALEALFLLDATLLATECVTVSASVGGAVAMALAGLAVAKLALVRRFLPDALPRSAAFLLGLQAVLVFVLPVAVVHLASERLLAPVSMYGLWWLTLGLPLARTKIQSAMASAHGGDGPRAQAVWSGLPAASILVHLAALGWIHQIDFHFAFLAPLLLGVAVCARREQVVRQIVLPAAAALVSLGQAEALGFPLLATAGPWISPLRIATLGAATAYAVLAWRHRHPWLLTLAAASGFVGVLGAPVSSLGAAARHGLRLAGRLLPHDALGWGLNGVVGAFVFLALGIWRSLRGDAPRRRPSPPRGRPWVLPRHGDIALALLLLALAGASILWAINSHPLGHREQRGPALTATLLAGAALILGARAQWRASRPPEDVPARQAALVALVGGLGGLLSLPIVAASTPGPPPRFESAVIGDMRTVVSAQAAYQGVNGGYADGALSCLARPAACIPGYGGFPPRFLDDELASLRQRKGYRRFFHPGPRPEEVPRSSSPTSVRTWAYVAVPVDPDYTGGRGFCTDSRGYICFKTDGTPPSLRPDGTCDLDSCRVLQ
jgi:hypothetical protein